MKRFFSVWWRKSTGQRQNRCVQGCYLPLRRQSAEQGETPYPAHEVVLWVFSATILRSFTSARNYATIALPKRQKQEVYERKWKATAKKALRGGTNGSRSPKRVSGDGSVPPRFLFAQLPFRLCNLLCRRRCIISLFVLRGVCLLRRRAAPALSYNTSTRQGCKLIF